MDEEVKKAFDSLTLLQKTHFYNFFDRVEDFREEVIHKHEDVIAYQLIEDGNPVVTQHILQEAKQFFEVFRRNVIEDMSWLEKRGIPKVLLDAVVNFANVSILLALEKRSKEVR